MNGLCRRRNPPHSSAYLVGGAVRRTARTPFVTAQVMTMSGQYRFIRQDNRRAIAGVAAACAAVVRVPVSVARILFVLTAILGFGIPLYLALWFLSPKLRPDGEVVSPANRIWSLGLLLLMPVLFAIGVAGLALPAFEALLLASGVAVGALMVRRGRVVVPTYLTDTDRSANPPLYGAEQVGLVDDRRKERSEQVKATVGEVEPAPKLGGVCAWISDRTGLNVTLVRISVVVATVFPPTFPLIPFLYGFAIFFVPRRDRTPAHVR